VIYLFQGWVDYRLCLCFHDLWIDSKFNLLSSDQQVWNHHFFWESMQPQGGGLPEGGVLQQIEKDFGSFTNFREEFIRSAVQLLGSGWVWLVCKFPSHFL
jgi:superoxide dismutase